MKILVFSDTHGSFQPMFDAVNREAPNYIIHLGDCVRDAERLMEMLPDCPVICVSGNCDPMNMRPELQIREICGLRFLITHGHKYSVKTGLLRLLYAAMEAQVEVVLFGHTHRPMSQEREGMMLINPGACGGTSPTYGLLTIEAGRLRCDIKAMT